MKNRSDCGFLKIKTDFYLRNINQKYRIECAQCTNIKQKVHDFEISKIEKNIKNMRSNIAIETGTKLMILGKSMRKKEEKKMFVFVWLRIPDVEFIMFWKEKLNHLLH